MSKPLSYLKDQKQKLNPLATVEQAMAIDRLAQEQYGISAEILMESAGALSAREIFSHEKAKEWTKSSVTILCGPGNNGGDGLVLARHLLCSGIDVLVFCPKDCKSSLLKTQKKRLISQGLTLHSVQDMEEIKKACSRSSLIIDALFGIGLSKNIENFYFDLICFLNERKNPLISLDIPSGLNANRGLAMGISVHADATISFGFAKPGFYLMDGPSFVGELCILLIGFPRKLFYEQANTHFLIDEPWVVSQLPKRLPTDHKACQGHLLVCAGREGFWGAGQLAALSAYRMGSGYVTWAGGDGREHPPIEGLSDVLTKSISDKDLFSKKQAVVIGPGLGVGEVTKKLLLDLKQKKIPVVVDADAFTLCVNENLFPLPSHWIVTPHSGELASLFHVKGEDIDQDRTHYAQEASQKTGALVLLKGFHSVLASKDSCWIVPTGNSALAKAGTGDVLAGFIGALLARGLSSFSATAVASFVHGKLADEWVLSGKDRDSLMAQDLKELLPLVLKKLRKE